MLFFSSICHPSVDANSTEAEKSASSRIKLAFITQTSPKLWLYSGAREITANLQYSEDLCIYCTVSVIITQSKVSLGLLCQIAYPV